MGIKDYRKYVESLKNKVPVFSLYRSYYEGEGLKERAKGENANVKEALASIDGQKKGYNVIKSVVDTVCSKISTKEPSPLFETVSGSEKKDAQVRQANDFVEAFFDIQHFYDTSRIVFRDALVFGTGIVFVSDEGLFRVYPENFFLGKNDFDGKKLLRCGFTQMLHEDEVTRRWPKFKKDMAFRKEVSEAEDFLEVTQFFDCLGKKKFVTVKGFKTDVEEEFSLDVPPFVFFSWNKSLSGFWGTPLVADIIQDQEEINKVIRFIEKSHEAVGSFWMVEAGSKILGQDLTNEAGKIVTYEGVQPNYVTPQATSGEAYRYRDDLISKVFERTGVSELSAMAAKPSGLDSQPALQTYYDIESERFSVATKDWEQFFIDVAKMIVFVFSASKKTIKIGGVGTMKEIAWKKIALSFNDFTVRISPISRLPKTFSGRMQWVQNMQNLGVLSDPLFVMKFFDMPDVDRISRLLSSSVDYAEYAVERVLQEKNPDLAISDVANLDYVKVYAQQKILELEVNESDEELIEALLKFYDKVNALIALKNAPASSPQAGESPQAPPPEPNESSETETAAPPVEAEPSSGKSPE